jgi:hypothetical protein
LARKCIQEATLCDPGKSYRKPPVTIKFWRTFNVANEGSTLETSTNHNEGNSEEGFSFKILVSNFIEANKVGICIT